MITLNQNKSLEVWVLLDETVGHNSQTLGVAEALALPYIKKKIFFNKQANLPNFLKFHPFNTINKKKSDILSKPWPDIIISCGRKLAPIALEVKKRAKQDAKQVMAVHIMWPGYNFGKFDIVAVPTHDRLSWLTKRSKNIIRIIGAPNRINKDFLLQEYRIWSRTIGELSSPRFAVLIGGTSKKGQLTMQHAKELIDKLVDVASTTKASLLVTNSRRTPENISSYIEENLRQKIGRHFYFHDVRKSTANPYFAYLQLADAVITTGDSISMCSEASSTGKPVFIFAPEGLVPLKHKKFHEDIINTGYAHYFDEFSINNILKNIGNLKKRRKILNAAEAITKEIIKKMDGN